MFGTCPDFKRLLPIAPSMINELRDDYRANFEIVSKELKFFSLQKSTERKQEAEMLGAAIHDTLIKSDFKCVQKLQEFNHAKKILFKIVMNSRNSKEVDFSVVQLKEITKELSDFLMNAEMVLVDQFEEIIKDFERNYIELCTKSVEFGQASCSRLRELENSHHEKFSESVIIFCERFNKGYAEDMDDEIRDVQVFFNADDGR